MKIKSRLKKLQNLKIGDFIYYNFFCKRVQRKKGAYLIPYKNSCIYIDKDAQLILTANFYINNYKPRGSKSECYLNILKEAKLYIKGDVSLRYQSSVQINQGAIAEFNHFTSNVGINIQCSEKIVIGEDCMIGRNVIIYDSAYHPTGTNIHNLTTSTKPVIIGNHVWLGTNVVISQGSIIGDGSIIGINSYISGNIPPNSMVMVKANEPAMSGIIWARSESDFVSAEKYLPQTENKPEKRVIKQSIKEIETQIKELFIQYISGIDYETEERMVDSGQIDSLTLMTAVALISDKFKVEIPYTEVNANNFNSIHNIAIMVLRILEEEKKEEKEIELSKAIKESEDFKNLINLKKSDVNIPIVQRIFMYAEKEPENIAVIVLEEEETYSNFAHKIYNLRLWLSEQKVEVGDKIVVQGIHSIQCIALYYAIHMAGAVLVPVEKNISELRIHEIALETHAKFIVSTNKADYEIDWFSYKDVYEICKRKNIYQYIDLDFPNPEMPCEMIFTTGTTGKSKGVVMKHKHISWYAYSVAKAVQMKKNNRLLITTPLNHAGGIRRTHLSLANGCTVVYLNGMGDLKKYFKYIERYKVTSLYLPPTTIRILLTRTGDELNKFKNQIDFVYSSSSSLPIGDCQKMKTLLPYTRLYNAYEASETPGVTVYDYNSNDIRENCVGKANEGVEIGIRQETGDIIYSTEVYGQICVKSLMNMQCYYNEPELTDKVTLGEWFVSNDLGYIDSEGNLYYKGRLGDVINIGGYKISPIEVEQVALLNDMINDCVCIEDIDNYGVNYLKLIVVPHEGIDLNSSKLIKHIKEYLEPYKVPRVVEIQKEIKRTYNGKIDRKSYRSIE